MVRKFGVVDFGLIIVLATALVVGGSIVETLKTVGPSQEAEELREDVFSKDRLDRTNMFLDLNNTSEEEVEIEVEVSDADAEISPWILYVRLYAPDGEQLHSVGFGVTPKDREPVVLTYENESTSLGPPGSDPSKILHEDFWDPEGLYPVSLPPGLSHLFVAIQDHSADVRVTVGSEDEGIVVLEEALIDPNLHRVRRTIVTGQWDWVNLETYATTYGAGILQAWTSETIYNTRADVWLSVGGGRGYTKLMVKDGHGNSCVTQGVYGSAAVYNTPVGSQRSVFVANVPPGELDFEGLIVHGPIWGRLSLELFIWDLPLPPYNLDEWWCLNDDFGGSENGVEGSSLDGVRPSMEILV